MEVRTPDPFPWPDDEISVEFGRSSYYGHKLERELKLLLLAADADGAISLKIPEEEEPETGELKPVSNSIEEFLYKATLGGLIHQYGLYDGWRDKKLRKRLYSALSARNELAHTALENHDPMSYDMPDRETLLQRLKDLRFRIGIPYLIIREARKLFEERIGITEEELQARLQQWKNDG